MNARWSNPGVALHWISAALIVGLVLAGGLMSDLAADAPLRQWLARGHTVGGVALMALTIVRLLHRRKTGSPRPLDTTPLHRRGIAVVHGLIYAAVFALGLSGMATARTSSHWHEYLVGDVGYAPDMAQVLMRRPHEALVAVLLVLVGLHVAGVMVHELRKGGALRRMAPFLR